MSFTIVELSARIIAGITMRTKNSDEMTTPKIPAFWQRFQQEQILNKIPNKVDPNIMYCVYTDYESDFTGEYTLLMGAQVSTAEKLPVDLKFCSIPQQKYALFVANSPEEILPTWIQIWNTPNLNRAYTADFQMHDLTTGKINIYTALKV